MTEQEVTADTFFNGRLRVKQHREGYRFSIDAVLLAFQADLQKNGTAADLGTGCGIIPLILAFRHPDARIYGVEIQKALAELAEINIRENGMSERITVYHQDMKSLTRRQTGGAVQLVVSNPPYRPRNSGRVNPHPQRAVARHEIKATLRDVVETARRFLDISGRFLTVYPANRLVDLISEMRKNDIEPKYLRAVHSRRNSEARLILTEGTRRGRPGLKVGPPLVIYEDDGSYTEETARMFSPPVTPDN